MLEIFDQWRGEKGMLVHELFPFGYNPPRVSVLEE